MIIGLVLLSAIIIASAQISLHLWRFSYFSLPSAFALFFVPLICALLLPFLARFDEIRYAVYAGIFSGILAMAIITIVFYSPSILGYIEFTDDYTALVIRQLLMSGLGIIPTTVVGSIIGGAFASERG